jgi:hypothetical protein
MVPVHAQQTREERRPGKVDFRFSVGRATFKQWEENMAARDMLNLNNALAPRLIRCLYIVALVLITVGVILGLVRGIRVMSSPPFPRPAMANNAAPAQTAAPATTPDAAPAPEPRPGMGMMGPGQRRMMMNRRGGPMMMNRRFGRPIGPFGIGRNPVLGGLWIIFGALLRGAIVLMVVRILAELGLAVLAMPRRSEI